MIARMITNAALSTAIAVASYFLANEYPGAALSCGWLGATLCCFVLFGLASHTRAGEPALQQPTRPAPPMPECEPSRVDAAAPSPPAIEQLLSEVKALRRDLARIVHDGVAVKTYE